MRIIHDPVETLQKEIQTWDSPFVELDCFGTANAEQIAEIVNEFCRAYLGSRLRGYFFYRASVGSTHALRLEDDREVVIKVRPPPQTNPDLRLDKNSLEAICAVITRLAERNYPCPRILLGPTPLARGLATVKEFIDRGDRGDGFQPKYRQIIASGLAELI